MRKKIVATVAVLTAATLLSGCWFLREASWTIDNVQPGKATTLKIGLLGIKEGDEPPARFFVMIGQEGSQVKLRRARFDTTQVLGKTKKMIKDPVLAGVVDACPYDGGVTFRTKTRVANANRKLIEATVRAKVPKNAGGATIALLTTGAWYDDGDGTPEPSDTSDDSYVCSGMATTGFRINAPWPNSRTRIPDSLSP